MFSDANSSNQDVSVVILTRNSARTIQLCLASVIGEGPREVVVVDALSTDDTLRIIGRYGVRLIVARLNSLGYSRKLGVEAAKGTFVMFVDSDVVLSKGCILAMKRELLENGWVGIHASLVSSGYVSYWQRAEDQAMGRRQQLGPRTRIGTAAALFYRSVLVRYPFDVMLKESSEDRDLSFRIVKDGYILGVSRASAYHLRRSDFPAFALRLFRYGLGDAAFSKKHGIVHERFLERMRTMAHYTAHSNIRQTVELVPYWIVTGAIQLFGFLVGLSKPREP